jgi:hypothetical protein
MPGGKLKLYILLDPHYHSFLGEYCSLEEIEDNSMNDGATVVITKNMHGKDFCKEPGCVWEMTVIWDDDSEDIWHIIEREFNCEEE